jgi:Holliday junction resolvase RusA-like endonuclease
MKFVIPMEAPTGNMYVRHTRAGRHYITKEASAWFAAVFMIARGSTVEGKAHEVSYTVFQGAKKKGDVDNYAKTILDALVKAGVLKSDASVVSLHCHKLRDRNNPRTEITVEAVVTPKES